jgi:predicted metalloprotease
MWLPDGQVVASACGELGDTAAAYCPGDDTIYISQKFATDIYDGALDGALPGSSQGFVGLFQSYGQQLPTMAFELQADCYAGTWAKSAYLDNRLEEGDVQEALDAALAVGDFDTSNPGHHGTPEQREQAWNSGFQTGDPAACGDYLTT